MAASAKLIICAGPVAALDVSTQARVVNLLEHLKEKLGRMLPFIVHDVALSKLISHHVAAMYLNWIVEITSALELFTTPLHPYTEALLLAVPPPM